MKAYNGYSSEQRNKAGAWLRRQWGLGAMPRPSKCCACGQTEGTLDAHAEDYSEPFAIGKTDQYPLCFTCHMMVHCRFKNPEAWGWYTCAIATGWRFPAVHGRNFPLFQQRFLSGPKALHETLLSATLHEAPQREPLVEISAPPGS